MSAATGIVQFIVDFDGTIAPHDTVDALLGKYAGPAWKDIEEAWVAGRINSRDCMQAQLALVTEARHVLDEFFQAIEIDPSFNDFVRYASRLGEVAIVSDGLDYPIHCVMEKYSVAPIPVFANRLEFRANCLGLSFPHASAGCTPQSGVCKCAVARRQVVGKGRRIVLIGDGRSDQCVAHLADVVFAKGSLRRYCEEAGIACTPFESFSDILTVLQGWSAVASSAAMQEVNHVIPEDVTVARSAIILEGPAERSAP